MQFTRILLPHNATGQKYSCYSIVMQSSTSSAVIFKALTTRKHKRLPCNYFSLVCKGNVKVSEIATFYSSKLCLN